MSNRGDAILRALGYDVGKPRALPIDVVPRNVRNMAELSAELYELLKVKPRRTGGRASGISRGKPKCARQALVDHLLHASSTDGGLAQFLQRHPLSKRTIEAIVNAPSMQGFKVNYERIEKDVKAVRRARHFRRP